MIRGLAHSNLLSTVRHDSQSQHWSGPDEMVCKRSYCCTLDLDLREPPTVQVSKTAQDARLAQQFSSALFVNCERMFDDEPQTPNLVAEISKCHR